MSTQVKIPDEVLDVLRQSRVEGDRLYLPPTQLGRNLYEKVNKTLAKLGGKWKGGKVGAHVFGRDVSEVIAGAVSAGTFTDEKKAFQFFETPRPVAERMIQLAGLHPCQMVLEPSAGKGAIARLIRERLNVGSVLHVCESNQWMREHLRAAGFHAVESVDFLLYRPAIPYDRIIQNPPFSTGQDAEHLLHAFDCLAPGGRLVSVMSAGITFRNDKVYREAASLVRDFGGSIEELPEGSFKESGTNTRTVLVTVNKP